MCGAVSTSFEGKATKSPRQPKERSDAGATTADPQESYPQEGARRHLPTGTSTGVQGPKGPYRRGVKNSV